jgi:16S rRNA processing protein RimM
MTTPQYALVGLVRKAHGIRGELVVEALTDAPDAIFAAGRRVFAGTPDGDPLPPPRGRGAPAAAEPVALTVRASSPFKGGLIVHFDAVTDRNEAELWRGRYLLLPVEELPPPADDEVYHHELLGMRMVLADGAPVGDVIDLYELPQGVVLDVRREDGKGTVVIPYRPEIVTAVDVATRVITIDPPEGLIE